MKVVEIAGKKYKAIRFNNQFDCKTICSLASDCHYECCNFNNGLATYLVELKDNEIIKPKAERPTKEQIRLVIDLFHLNQYVYTSEAVEDLYNNWEEEISLHEDFGDL